MILESWRKVEWTVLCYSLSDMVQSEKIQSEKVELMITAIYALALAPYKPHKLGPRTSPLWLALDPF